MKDRYRGHAIAQVNAIWVYEDTAEPVQLNPNRACGECGEPNTAEGHDACIGALPGVMNACCGHGVTAEAYVQFEGGGLISGQAAVQYFKGAAATR